MKTMDNFEKQFRDWAKENRLRLTTHEDKFPIVRSRSRKYPDDHLYDGFTAGVGLWVSRPTQARMTYLRQRLTGWGCKPLVTCETEATFFIPWVTALEVAKKMGMVKKAKGKPNKGWFKYGQDVEVDG